MKQTSELDSVAQILELADGMQNHYDYHVKSSNKKKSGRHRKTGGLC